MSNISDWINNEVYPALFEVVPSVFPEHNFTRGSSGWQSNTYLDGKPHRRPDKTVIAEQAPYCIMEQGGDRVNIYKYIKEREGLDDKGALDYLARATGLKLPKGDYKAGSYKGSSTVREAAQAYFSFTLEKAKEDSVVKKYLRQRGYTDEVVKAMGLGVIYSQDKLKSYLRDKGYTHEEIGSLGLLPQMEKSHRLTIPYRVSGGRIEGFLVRALGSESPKYLYTKGMTRRGNLAALTPVGRPRDVVIVEGLLDALHAQATGFSNVVGLGGASVSKEQIEAAATRGIKSITLCLDSDKAGTDATKRASNIIRENSDLSVFIAKLPDGIKDPDQLLKEQGPAAFNTILDQAKTDFEEHLEELARIYLAGEKTAKRSDELLERVVTYGATLKSPVDKARYSSLFTKGLGNVLGLKEADVEATIDRLAYNKVKEDQEKKLKATLAEASKKAESGDVNSSLELLSKQSKQILLEGSETAYNSLLKPPTEDEVREKIAAAPDSIKSGYEIDGEELLLPSGALSFFAAPTSHGKTTMLVNLLLNTVSPGKQIHFFSYEESREAVTLKTLNTYIGQELSKNNRRSLEAYYRDNTEEYISPAARAEFNQKKTAFYKDLVDSGALGLHYVDYTVEELVGAIQYLNKNANVGAVFIDYMQLLRKRDGRYNSRQEELKQVCLDLKDVAVETGLPIILGAQFNREVTHHGLIHPTKIGEAGDIERIANTIIGLWNNNFDPLNLPESEANRLSGKGYNKKGTLYGKVLKSRYTKPGAEAVFSFDGNTGKIGKIAASKELF